MAYLWHPDGRTLWPVNTLQLQFLISILAGWVNRGQQDRIEYLQEENRVLREQLGKERLATFDQRIERPLDQRFGLLGPARQTPALSIG